MLEPHRFLNGNYSYRVGAPAGTYHEQRTLVQSGSRCHPRCDDYPLSLVNVNSYIGFTAARKPWVRKVIVNGTRTQFTLLEGYRCEGHLRSRSNSSCTLLWLSTVETVQGYNGSAIRNLQVWFVPSWSSTRVPEETGPLPERPMFRGEFWIKMLRF